MNMKISDPSSLPVSFLPQDSCELSAQEKEAGSEVLESHPKFPFKALRFKWKKEDSFFTKLFEKDDGEKVLSFFLKNLKAERERTLKDWDFYRSLAILLDKKKVFKYLNNNGVKLSFNSSYENNPYFTAKSLQADYYLKEIEKNLSKKDKKRGDLLVDSYCITNYWKLGGNIRIGKSRFKLLGGHPPLFLKTIEDYSKKFFLQLIKEKPENKLTHQESFEAISFMKNATLSSLGNLRKRIESGKVTSIPTGWKGHGINATFLKTKKCYYLAVSNRGESAEKGISVYKTEEKISKGKWEKVLNKISSNGCRKFNKEFILNKVHEILKLKHFFDVPHQAQKVPNCTWISNMTAVHAIMLLSKIKLKLTFEESCKKSKENKLFSLEERESFIKDIVVSRGMYKFLIGKIKEGEAAAYLKKYRNAKAAKGVVKALKEKQLIWLKKENRRKLEGDERRADLFF
jgi:hypothetical protein